VAGVGKVLAGTTGYDAFLFPSFLPETLSVTAYAALPYTEIIIGLLLVLGIGIKLATCVSAALIVCFITSNLYLLSIGVGTCGGCFGVAGGLTVYAALVIDGLMAIAATIIFVSHTGPYFNKIPWYFKGHTVTRCASAQCSRGA